MSNQQKTRRELEWSQVDVFADAPLEGNMLAIFHDGKQLSDAEMQALARETNLSETTFLLPRSEAEERQHGVRVRIFTTGEELPFAGHPTLGTASWLWLHHPHFCHASEIKLQLNSGPVRVRFSASSTGTRIVGEMTQHDPVFGTRPDPGGVAAALGLEKSDLHPDLKPQVVSTGLPFLIVPLRSIESGRNLVHVRDRLQPLLVESGAHFSYCIAPAAAPDSVTSDSAAPNVTAQWHARMLFNGGEDPATGSAAGCAISYLVQHGVVMPDEPVVIRQGLEVQRPSRIQVQASLSKGLVRNVRVGGSTIPVASGRFFLE